jgi:hypothetical protein
VADPSIATIVRAAVIGRVAGGVAATPAAYSSLVQR